MWNTYVLWSEDYTPPPPSAMFPPWNTSEILSPKRSFFFAISYFPPICRHCTVLWRAGYTPADRLTSWGVLYHPCTVPVYKLLFISQYVNQCCRTSCLPCFHSTFFNFPFSFFFHILHLSLFPSSAPTPPPPNGAGWYISPKGRGRIFKYDGPLLNFKALLYIKENNKSLTEISLNMDSLAGLVDNLLQKVGKFLDYGDRLTAGEADSVERSSRVVTGPACGETVY